MLKLWKAPSLSEKEIANPRSPEPVRGKQDGGEGWIRTSVRLRGQIYSLLPLTTRPPLQVRQARHVAGRQRCVNALHQRGCRRPSLRSCAPDFNSPPDWRIFSPRSLFQSSRALHARLFSGQTARGAGEGNRTLVVSLEGFCSTIELHPRRVSHFRDRTLRKPARGDR